MEEAGGALPRGSFNGVGVEHVGVTQTKAERKEADAKSMEVPDKGATTIALWDKNRLF